MRGLKGYPICEATGIIQQLENKNKHKHKNKSKRKKIKFKEKRRMYQRE